MRRPQTGSCAVLSRRLAAWMRLRRETNIAQFFTVRSRIGLQTMADGTGADLAPGDDLAYDYATHRVKLLDIAGGNPTKAELWSRIGTLYEVYTKSKITEKKKKTASGDVVVIDFGIGVA